MVKDYYEVQELADLLDLDEVSAREMLDGITYFELHEISVLASRKGVSVTQLLASDVEDSALKHDQT